MELVKQHKQAAPAQRHTFRLNLFITFVGFLDTHLLIPIMALFATGLGAGIGLAGLIIGINSVTNTIANIIAGRLIDRAGPRGPLLGGLLGDALAMFAYSLSRNPLQLLLVRAFHGFSGGFVGPATMSITAHHSTSGRTGRAMGFYGMSLALATLVGYPLSAILSARLGYSAIFYIGSGMLLLGAVAGAALPPADRSTPGGQARSSFRQEWGRVVSLLTRKGLYVSYVSIFAQYFAFGGVVTLLPLYMSSLGFEAFHFGMLLAGFGITFIILQLPSGGLSDRHGRRGPAAAGLALVIVSVSALPAVSAFPGLVGVMVLYGAGYALIFPSISAIIADNTSGEERGRATGLFHALLTAGVAIGAPAMGWVAEATSVRLALGLCSIAAIAALIVVLAGARGARRTPAPAP